MIVKLLSEQIQGRLVRERILSVTELSTEEWASESIAHLHRSNTMGEVLRAGSVRLVSIMLSCGR